MFLLLLACTSEPPATEAPTWHANIRPLVEESCVSCHTSDGLAPFAFDDWATVQPLAPMMVEAVENRTMPPSGYDTDCRDIVGSTRLTDAEVARFSDWAAASYPEGNPGDYVAPRLPVSQALREPDIVAAPVEHFLPDTTLTDDYRCMWADHIFDVPTWVLAASAWPDQVEAVHHVITYAVPPSAWEQVEALDAADPDPGYTCFSGPMVDAVGLGGWVPGGEPTPLEVDVSSDTAQLIPAGSRVLVEVHYNTLALNKESVSDLTTIPIWTLPEGVEPAWRLNTITAYDPNLSIPPGAVDHTEEVTITLPFEGELVATSPHMHQLATGLDTVLLRDDEETCITSIDPWDFNWQRGYSFVEPEELRFNDTIRLQCHYDNPGDTTVTWGDGTSDEMCIDYLSYRVPWKGDASDGMCAGFKECHRECEADDEYCLERCMSSAGEECLSCGVDAMFEAPTCSAEASSAVGCLYSCRTAETDWWGCLVGTCEAEWNALADCVEDGELAGLETCAGLIP